MTEYKGTYIHKAKLSSVRRSFQCISKHSYGKDSTSLLGFWTFPSQMLQEILKDLVMGPLLAFGTVLMEDKSQRFQKKVLQKAARAVAYEGKL